LGVDFCLDSFSDSPRSGQQDRRRINTVFRLREHVGRHQLKIGCLVGNDQGLGWPRDLVDVHHAKDLLFGQCHEHVAWTQDLVDVGNCLGAKGKRGNRLRTTHRENLVNASHERRRQNHWRDCSIPTWRCCNDDFVDSCHSRWNCDHQQRRRQSRRPPWRINPHPVQRPYELAENAQRLRFDPAWAGLFAVKLFDPFGGCF
jgi:hypothetical protein